MADEKEQAAKDAEATAKAGDAAAAASGSAAAGTAGAKKAGGDLTVALHQMRKQNRELMRLLAAKTNTEPQKLDLKPLGITNEDLDKGDVEAINAKLTQALAAAADLGAQRALQQVAGTHSAEAILAKYAIFSDADTELAEDASRVAAGRIAALPEGATAADVEKVVEAVAKRFSALKATAAPAAAGADTGTAADAGPLPAGGGAGGVAHLKDVPAEAPTTAAKARQLARDIGARFLLAKQITQ